MRSGPAAGKNVNDGNRFGSARVAPVAAGTQLEDHAARGVPEGQSRTVSTARNSTTSTTTSSPSPAADLGKRTQYLKMREKFRDKTTLADLTASYDFGPVELTSVTSYIHRDILVSRDARR